MYKSLDEAKSRSSEDNIDEEVFRPSLLSMPQDETSVDDGEMVVRKLASSKNQARTPADASDNASNYEETIHDEPLTP